MCWQDLNLFQTSLNSSEHLVLIHLIHFRQAPLQPELWAVWERGPSPVCAPPDWEQQAVAALYVYPGWAGLGTGASSTGCCSCLDHRSNDPSATWQLTGYIIFPPPATDMHEVSSKFIVNNLKNLSLEVPVQHSSFHTTITRTDLMFPAKSCYTYF